MSAKDALEHLEALRETIERSVFRLRKTDRRSAPRTGDPDRRRTTRKKAPTAPVQQPANELSVTVSIGVAEASTRNRTPEQVIEAADQALYQAKRNGRNRVELAGATPARPARARRSGISQA
jgi:PleD family two-component response regulator